MTKTATSALYDDNGEITIVYTVTFHGDDLRGNVPQLVVKTNLMVNSTQALHAIDIATSTTTEGNEPSGSFYLSYKCESRLTDEGFSAAATVGSNQVVLTKAAVVGQTLRLKTGTSLWSYFKVVEEGTVTSTPTYTVKLDRDFTAAMGATGSYVADVGVFYSNATDPYGVSQGCYAADPDTTLRMDHDISAGE